jgi:hypothetical protein
MLESVIELPTYCYEKIRLILNAGAHSYFENKSDFASRI